jgi:hypothetical protein
MPPGAARVSALLLVILLTGGFAACPGQAPVQGPVPDTGAAWLAAQGPPVSFARDVKPVLDGRCVVCHSCWDAPCQLILQAFEGVQRGASREPVYDSSRLVTKPPTRLFVDAHTTEEWRKKGFFSVLGGSAGPPVLTAMLALGHANPFPAGARLPDDVALDIDRKLECPGSGDFERYAREHPHGGMPYGMAPLTTDELRILASFVAQETPAPAAPALPAAAQAEVARWEAFLNGSSLKERVVARYLYEHWFLAHLAFDDLPRGPFFRVMRSRTPPGEPPDEIATVRPYDDPGTAEFWYRIVPLEATIVHKTHIVYRLGDRRMRRLRELFLGSDWRATRLPDYSPDVASNPFIAFQEIPARSRYTFLLDDAHYFVMTFIRGPVCRGQVAVDVIEDQFWVAFLDPDHDLSVKDPKFLEQAKDLLALPAKHEGVFLPGELWLSFSRYQLKYMRMRERYYDDIDPHHRGPALDWIWDGDRRNPNALLTVFRNFDNATVVEGFVGEIPKTAWVMDYPIFERIYYNLVAGFDIFGNVAHQVSTRLYMDNLRMQSENLFLGFLPADRRKAIRASWYIDATRELDYAVVNRMRSLEHGTQVRFTSPDVKADLLLQVLAQAGPAAGPPDLQNRCGTPPCDPPGASAEERAVERELRRVASVRGDFVRWLPEVSVLRVRVDASGRRDLVYTLVHNDAHTNVAFMFDEEERRIPEQDTLTVVRGHFGSYPNFFFETDAAGIRAFVDELAAVHTEADLTGFVDRHGIRRTSARFWETSDWLRADLARRDPTRAGIYDLDRYQNL